MKPQNIGETKWGLKIRAILSLSIKQTMMKNTAHQLSVVFIIIAVQNWKAGLWCSFTWRKFLCRSVESAILACACCLQNNFYWHEKKDQRFTKQRDQSSELSCLKKWRLVQRFGSRFYIYTICSRWLILPLTLSFKSKSYVFCNSFIKHSK